MDPTCGSGTTAYVAEQWGRRWITIDTSRVALALARARIMGARYTWYLLADSPEGQLKEAEVERREPSSALAATYGDIRQGFVYERVAAHHPAGHRQQRRDRRDGSKWEPRWRMRRRLRGRSAGPDLSDGLVVRRIRASQRLAGVGSPRERRPTTGRGRPRAAGSRSSGNARIARQQEIDASIAAKADYEYLYDKPYEDRRTVRVAGPFTVESLSPHRMLGVDEHGELIDRVAETPGHYGEPQDFADDDPGQPAHHRRTASAQRGPHHLQLAHALARSLRVRGGALHSGKCGSGQWLVKRMELRAFAARDGSATTGHWSPATGATAIRARRLHRPRVRHGLQRQDLVEAAREAAEAGFDLLIACAFNYEAHATEFDKLGKIPVLKARMNADLHMAGELKNTGQGNLFVIFGEPDIAVASGQWSVASD